MSTISTTARTRLAQYVLELYKDWATLRRDREIEWQRTLDAFNAENSDFWQTPDAEDWQSDAFPKFTKMKVMAAKALVIDTVFQGGQVPFLLKPVIGGLDETTAAGFTEIAESAQKQINDQLADCKADREFFMAIYSMAMYGEGWLKAPLVKNKQRVLIVPQPDQFGGMSGVPQRETETIPSCEYVSVWDVFWDTEARDHHEGIGVIERQLISPYQLREKVGAPFFDQEAIERVIAQSTASDLSAQDTTALTPRLRNVPRRRSNIVYLEFWGRVPRAYLDDFAQTGPEGTGFVDGNPETAGIEDEVQVCLANDEVVRVVKTPAGMRPYHRAAWEDALDDAHGIGIGDNLRSPQQIINAGVRKFLDNKGISGNVMFGGKSSYLAAGQSRKARPGKWFELAEDIDDVRKAIMPIVVPDVGETLLSMIGLGERYADEESNLPKVIQGDVAEKKKPDTLGEMNILVSQAGKYLGQVIRNIDEGLIEPVVEWFHNWNLMQGQTEIAGNALKVNATGFSSFSNRVIRGQNLRQFLSLVMSSPPLFQEARVRPMLEEIAKSLDLDPDQVLKSEQEKFQDQMMLMQQMQAQAALEQQGDGVEKKLNGQARRGMGA